MGKIQCTSQRSNHLHWEIIEKSLKNANTPLERKIHDEYHWLKSMYKEKDRIEDKEKLENFVRWYRMAHCDESEKSGKSYNKNTYQNGVDLEKGEKLDQLNRFKKEDSELENYFKWRDISSIDLNPDSSSLSLSSLSGSTIFIDNLYELNLRNFFEKSKSAYTERMMEGGPESFRWLSWVVSVNLPSDRCKDLYINLCLEKLDDQTDTQIKKDLNRTLVEILSTEGLGEVQIKDIRDIKDINQESNLKDPAHNYLYRVLRAFSNIDKEVAYCQGMNFIVGFLLIASDFNETDTFYMILALFSHTYNEKFGIRGFFSEGFPLLRAYCHVFNHFLMEKMPRLRKHFLSLDLPDEVWISKWMQTLFTICLPFEATVRLWDCILAHGIEFIISFSLAFVKQFEQDLLQLEDAFDVIDYFKKVFSRSGGGNKMRKENYIYKGDTNSGFIFTKFEEILIQARKMNISSSSIEFLKREYEKLENINLESVNKGYMIRKQTKKFSVSTNIMCELLPSTLCHTRSVNSNNDNGVVVNTVHTANGANLETINNNIIINNPYNIEVSQDLGEDNIEEGHIEDGIDLKLGLYTFTPKIKMNK